jgi:hypothetical protein
VAPVNRIPSEILTLIPDFWHKYGDRRDRDLVTLTHVCRAWREMFTSRSSLWADLDCKNYDRARVYLERSKSLPINLSLHADNHLPSHHPFFEIIPHAIGRLRSLFIEGPLEDLRGITDHTPRPAPLLEKLLICGDHHYKPHLRPVVAPALFGGDFSSLCSLGLRSVRTELPWRNMVNLTSFKLHYMSLGEVSIGQRPSPPQSQHLRSNSNLWCSKWAVGVTAVLKEDGDRRWWFGFPLARSPVDPGRCAFGNRGRASQPPNQRPSPQVP